VDLSFQLLWANRRKCDCWIEWKSRFSFVRNRQAVFQGGCRTLPSYQRWASIPLAPHPGQHGVLSMLRRFALLMDRCVVVACDFNLQFPDDVWWASFHIYHLSIFFGDLSVQVFGPFLNQVVFSYPWVTPYFLKHFFLTASQTPHSLVFLLSVDAPSQSSLSDFLFSVHPLSLFFFIPSFWAMSTAVASVRTVTFVPY